MPHLSKALQKGLREKFTLRGEISFPYAQSGAEVSFFLPAVKKQGEIPENLQDFISFSLFIIPIRPLSNLTSECAMSLYHYSHVHNIQCTIFYISMDTSES